MTCYSQLAPILMFISEYSVKLFHPFLIHCRFIPFPKTSPKYNLYYYITDLYPILRSSQNKGYLNISPNYPPLNTLPNYHLLQHHQVATVCTSAMNHPHAIYSIRAVISIRWSSGKKFKEITQKSLTVAKMRHSAHSLSFDIAKPYTEYIADYQSLC